MGREEGRCRIGELVGLDAIQHVAVTIMETIPDALKRCNPFPQRALPPYLQGTNVAPALLPGASDEHVRQVWTLCLQQMECLGPLAREADEVDEIEEGEWRGGRVEERNGGGGEKEFRASGGRAAIRWGVGLPDPRC